MLLLMEMSVGLEVVLGTAVYIVSSKLYFKPGTMAIKLFTRMISKIMSIAYSNCAALNRVVET